MKVVFVAFKGKEGKYRTQCNLEYAVKSIKIFLEIVEIMLLKKQIKKTHNGSLTKEMQGSTCKLWYVVYGKKRNLIDWNCILFILLLLLLLLFFFFCSKLKLTDNQS